MRLLGKQEPFHAESCAYRGLALAKGADKIVVPSPAGQAETDSGRQHFEGDPGVVPQIVNLGQVEGQPVGACSSGAFGDLCNAPADCMSNNCFIGFPGQPGFCM